MLNILGCTGAVSTPSEQLTIIASICPGILALHSKTIGRKLLCVIEPSKIDVTSCHLSNDNDLIKFDSLDRCEPTWRTEDRTSITISEAHPGFPAARGADPTGAVTYDFAKIFLKIHEI